MLILTSPAKTQDFESSWETQIEPTKPQFLTDASKLIEILQKKSKKKLQGILGVSEKLVEENYERYQNWEKSHKLVNSKPALLAYKGDIYRQFKANGFSKSEQVYAQKSLRIITGLYGILRAYDLIQPYRLEMKTDLETNKESDLYEFWGKKLTNQLNKDIRDQNHKLVLNLASKEYSHSISFKDLKADYVTVEFKQTKNGTTKNYGILSKFARGVMIDWCIKNKVKTLEKLKQFDMNGYRLEQETLHKLLFVSKSDKALHSAHLQ